MALKHSKYSVFLDNIHKSSMSNSSIHMKIGQSFYPNRKTRLDMFSKIKSDQKELISEQSQEDLQ